MPIVIATSLPFGPPIMNQLSAPEKAENSILDKQGVIESLFRVKRALIGVVHLQALPGTPANKLEVAAIASIAVDEACTYRDAGFHGILIENTHDRGDPESQRFLNLNFET
jgi:BtpA family